MKQSRQAKQQQLLTRWREAISTPAFRTYHVTMEALENALPQARQRSIQRLIQSIFREGLIDPALCEYEGQHSCRLTLNDGIQLQFGHLSLGRMGSWELHEHISVQRADHSPHAVEFPSELLQLLNPLFDSPISNETLERVSLELDDSVANDTLCLAFHDAWSHRLQQQVHDDKAFNLLAWLRQQTATNATLLLEQWGTLGHPWHPIYKTKLGMSTEQTIAFSPEFAASFPVILCALHNRCVHVETIPGTVDQWKWWHRHFSQATQELIIELQDLGLEAADYIPLPVHPWQVKEQLPQLFANEIGDRLLVVTRVVAFKGHPTMSFRTLVPDARSSAPMIKLPVALQLTSVQRTLSSRSVQMGPRISHLLQQILDQEPEIQANISIVSDRIGLHYQPPTANDDRARHLSALYRDNPQSLVNHGELAVPVGSLFAHDPQGQPLLRQWVRLAEGREDAAAMHSFFRKYLSIAVPGLLGMYLLYGVAFEGHQQNSLMVMGVDRQPARLLLRDFGDLRIQRSTLQAHGLDIESHDPAMTLFDDPCFVRDKLLHATFMCHLGELVLLCARHWDAPAELLWDELAEHVCRYFDAVRERVEPLRWATEREALLKLDWPAKSLLRMRLMDTHADIIGRLKNPLCTAAHEG
jgi:siderophore synthetase component